MAAKGNIFKKLKWTFVAITMSMLTVVLVAVLVIFNIVSNNAQVEEIRVTLESAVKVGPNGMGPHGIGPVDFSRYRQLYVESDEDGIESFTLYLERELGLFGIYNDGAEPDEAGDGGGLAGLPPQDGSYGRLRDSSIPVYCVTVDSTGAITGKTSDVYMDPDVLDSAVSALSGADDGFGELGEYQIFYMTGTVVEGRRMAFADASDFHESAGTRLLASVLIGGIVFIVLFIIAMILSKFALRPVEEAWAGQQRFIADASHELKTPLTVILANNEIIGSNPDSTVAEQERWVEGIHEEALKMQGLVQDLLVLAQTEPDAAALGSSGAELTTVDFSGMVERDVLQFEAVAFEKGVELVDEVEEGLAVKADADKLDRVVRVLLDNACKYSGKTPGDELAAAFEQEDADGTADADAEGFASGLDAVRVSLVREKGHAVLRVNNGGKPIDPEDLPHVFDRFFRSDKSRGGETEGFGLGLPIAKNIVEGIGGSIGVESNSAQGTTFTVRIPLA